MASRFLKGKSQNRWQHLEGLLLRDEVSGNQWERLPIDFCGIGVRVTPQPSKLVMRVRVPYLAPNFDPIAQPEEHLTFNQGVESSSLSGITICVGIVLENEVENTFNSREIISVFCGLFGCGAGSSPARHTILAG